MINFSLNISKYIGLLHLSGMIIESIYGFIFVKHVMFDKLYMISFTFIPFSWIVCNDECIISYLIKKNENPRYRLGDEPENVEDISNFFTNKPQYILFNNINYFLRLFSVIIVNHRTTKISYDILIPTVIFYSFYIYDISYKLNYRKKMHPYFQIIFCLYLLNIFCKIVMAT